MRDGGPLQHEIRTSHLRKIELSRITHQGLHSEPKQERRKGRPMAFQKGRQMGSQRGRPSVSQRECRKERSRERQQERQKEMQREFQTESQKENQTESQRDCLRVRQRAGSKERQTGGPRFLQQTAAQLAQRQTLCVHPVTRAGCGRREGWPEQPRRSTERR